ncbi:MAG: hypothetical protein ACOYBX_01320 [Mycobacterium sp.]
MSSATLTRRIALVAGGAAIIGMGALTAGCGSSAKEAPATSTTPSASTSAPALSPTEKVTIIHPEPSLEDRGGMDSHPCPPGSTKYNGVCQ